MQNILVFYEPITKNKFPLFGSKQKPDSKAIKSKLANLKDDCNLFSRLFISCQSRQCDLADFFQHENQKYPPSLSYNGSINSGIKSQLMSILENELDVPVTEPPTDTLIIDGMALVNSRQPGPCKTFDKYADDVILPQIEHSRQWHGRIDIVFDVYYEDSLKGETRRKRGMG